MRIFVIVNRLAEVGYRQTTSLLAASLNRLHGQVVIAPVDALSLNSLGDGAVFDVNGIQLADNARSSDDVAAACASPADASTWTVSCDDILVIRTNPGRDDRRQLHNDFLQLAEIAVAQGITVINDPSRLTFFANKSSLALLDSRYRPPMLVTSCPDQVVQFVNDAPGNCVVKPVVGSRGANVLQINSNTEKLPLLLQKTYPTQQMIVQHFITADQPGDRRIVVFDGKILETTNAIAGIERRPAPNDFRGNLHAGGTAHRVSLTELQRAAVEHAASLLMDNGIRLAGVDLVGDQVIEFNVFSTGGLFDANRFASIDFTETIASRILGGIITGRELET